MSASTPDTQNPNDQGSAVMQAAPGAVRHSMPIALSIMLGLLGAAVVYWFVQSLFWLIMLLYLAFVIASILNAPVEFLIKRKFPRGIAVAVVLVVCILLVGGVITLLSGEMISQSQNIANEIKRWPTAITNFSSQIAEQFPTLAAQLGATTQAAATSEATTTTTTQISATTQKFEIDFIKTISEILPAWSSVVAKTLNGISIITSGILLFCMVLYMMLEGAEILHGLSNLLPLKTRKEASEIFTKLISTHRRWFAATSINMISTSILSTIGLSILGIPSALVLGFITGFGELVPNIGPIIVIIPSLLMTLILDHTKFWWVIIMFAIVQAIQGYGISPFVMKMGVKLPVLALVVAVLAMGSLLGPLGILVAIPLTADLIVFWHYFNSILAKPNLTTPTAEPPV